MKEIGFHCQISSAFQFRGYRIFWYRESEVDGKAIIEVIKTQEIKEINPIGYSGFPDDCGIIMEKTQMQELADRLWDAGFKPTQGHGSAGQLSSTQEHLKDSIEVRDRMLSMVEKIWEKK